MSSSHPVVVFIKEHSDTTEVKFNMPWFPDKDDLPDIIPLRGLSAKRQWYLYEQIRSFCLDEGRDITCPLLTVRKPGQSTPVPEEVEEVPGPPKRKRNRRKD